MRIGIAGFGKMGSLIRETALARGHLVPAVIDPWSDAREVTGKKFTAKTLPLDVIIDFTSPQAILDNIKRYGELNIPAVIGTTGWYEKMSQAARIVEKSGIGLIWSGNFSLGVNIFFRLIEKTAAIMNGFPEYDVLVQELHHNQKADSPSGTARMIGDILIDRLDRKKAMVTGMPSRSLENYELHLASGRGGFIPGQHAVLFDSEVDTITLEHTARSRLGFAEGAVMAAEWIKDRHGFYNINDLMDSIVGSEDHE
ncbi:MAG TPA: 4-hydroxy-tetrahydrodipicolinate reductase [Firmicutes bacterium]|nr:4-hydroxy-tetrahydrodipicolinate reductase [Bacillota bacterium]